MIQVCYASIIVLVAYIFTRYYVKPNKKIQTLAKRFEQKGYRVFKRPIVPFIGANFYSFQKNAQKGDSMKDYKNLFPKYDVELANLKDDVRICLMNPKLIREFAMTEKDYTFEKAQLFQKTFQRLAKGLAFHERDEWRKRRRVLSNVFNYDFIVLMAPRISQIFQTVLIECENESKLRNKSEIQFDINFFTAEASMKVVLECFLGCDCSKLEIVGKKLSTFIVNMLDQVVVQMMNPLNMIMGKSFVQNGFFEKDRIVNRKLKLYDEWSRSFISEKIKKFEQQYERGERQKPKDLIETLIVQNYEARSKSKLDDIFTKEEIIDEFKTFLMVGTDTTSHFLQLMIFYISKNPSVEKEVRKQIDEFMGDNDFSIDNLKNLKYIDAVMKETTRIYGPANFILLRQATRDCQLDGVNIPKGTALTYNSIAIHYNEDIYPQPFQFKPERWLNGQCQNINPYEHVGFGVGPRSCIGRQLALLQAKGGLVKFMKRYAQFSVPKQKLRMASKFAYVPEHFNIRAKLSSTLGH